MTYFELFDIPVQLKVNTDALSKKFFELSRKHHPDFFTNETEDIQAEALEKSAMLNKAWKTFQNPAETIKYVLIEKGLLEVEEKYELPPDFLMAVLEINEQLMEMDETADKGEIKSVIAQLSNEIFEPVEEIIKKYNDSTTTDKELLQVKEFYYKKKYLDRISKELPGMA